LPGLNSHHHQVYLENLVLLNFISLYIHPHLVPPSYFATLALPPLPAGISAPAEAWVEDEEQADSIFAVGTDEWCEFQVMMKTKKARCYWVTLHGHEEGSEKENEAKRWWPQSSAWKPWAVGLCLEDADLLVKEGTKWK
jgi:hypothetical protein